MTTVYKVHQEIDTTNEQTTTQIDMNTMDFIPVPNKTQTEINNMVNMTNACLLYNTSTSAWQAWDPNFGWMVFTVTNAP